MRLLVVSYWYTPTVSPRAFRWSALAEHWASAGHQVDVVAAWAPGLAREETLNGVRVHRVGRNVRASVRSALRSLAARRGGSAAPVSDTRTSTDRASITSHPLHFRAARWVYDRTWKKVYWPDDAGPWYFPASRAAERLAERGAYDALVSVSHPFTGHLVGARLHARMPGVPWLADVGDPFSFLERTPTNNHRLYRGLNHRAERRVFQGADAVAVTTEPTREIYARLFPESAAKVRVVPPLLPETEAGAYPRVFPDDGRIRLVFAGNLYRSIREPGFLLRLFRMLGETRLGDRAELHFFGNVRDCWDAFEPYRDRIDRSVFLHGTVNRDHAMQAMREAAVLVNLGNDTLYQLPSKVVEYAGLRKPVLNLVRAEEDSSAEFFRSYPAALTLVDRGQLPTPEEAERLLDLLLRAGRMEPHALDAWLAAYRVEAVAAGYESLLGLVPPSAAAGPLARPEAAAVP